MGGIPGDIVHQGGGCGSHHSTEVCGDVACIGLGIMATQSHGMGRALPVATLQTNKNIA